MLEELSQTMPAILTAALIGGSLLVWTGILFSWLYRVPGLFPSVSSQHAKPPRLSLFVGGIFLILVMSSLLATLSLEGGQTQGQTDDDQSAAPITLEHVQINAAYNSTVVLIIFLSGAISGEPLTGLGLRKADIAGQIWDAFVGFLVAIGPVFLVLHLTDEWGLRDDEHAHEYLKLLIHSPSREVWLWIGLSAVVVAPLSEELLFRVILQGWVESVASPSLAIILSSLLFCLVHEFPDSLALAPLALTLGYVYHKRQSYLTVVVIHAIFNAVNLLLTALQEMTAM